MIQIPSVDRRLSAALAFARQGKIPLDVGTDHAFLPILLLLRGLCPRAVASDVNAGPLARAEQNAARYGVTSRMHFYLSDGIGQIPLEEEQIGDVYLCGMGGELMAKIIGDGPALREQDRRLILQPMTMADKLRAFLCESGYRVMGESLAKDGRHLYAVIAAEYDGVHRRLSAAEQCLGPEILKRGCKDPLFGELLRREIRRVEIRLEGLRRGGMTDHEAQGLLDELKDIAGKEGILL